MFTDLRFRNPHFDFFFTNPSCDGVNFVFNNLRTGDKIPVKAVRDNKGKLVKLTHKGHEVVKVIRQKGKVVAL